MKKAAVVLAAVIALSMMLMAVAPVLAKPYSVTVTVKDSSNKPVEGVQAYIVLHTGDTSQDMWIPSLEATPNYYVTDGHGKVTFSWTDIDPSVYPFWGFTLYLNGNHYQTWELNKKQSTKVTVTYPPLS